MANLTVRNLDDTFLEALEQRAADHGRTVEAELLEILKRVLLPTKSSLDFKAFLRSMPDVGDDEDFTRSKDLGRAAE